MSRYSGVIVALKLVNETAEATAVVDLERLPGNAQTRMGQRLGVTVPSLTIRLHGSIDGFRRATGQPWWVSSVVRGAEIDLAPVAVLDQRAFGGQAGASMRIENYLGFPTGISGQALADQIIADFFYVD